MARKRHTAEEIVAKLRQVNVLIAKGRLVAGASDRRLHSQELRQAYFSQI